MRLEDRVTPEEIEQARRRVEDLPRNLDVLPAPTQEDFRRIARKAKELIEALPRGYGLDALPARELDEGFREYIEDKSPETSEMMYGD